MNPPRLLSSEETAVISTLLNAKPETRHLIAELESLSVSKMEDGGMGSLLLIPPGSAAVGRRMGKVIVLGEFSDSDGIPVIVSVNLDREGMLFELDVWKVDFSPLLKWPDPGAIRFHELP